ncbi:endolytic transglycosylase MltG [Jiella endophytica]|uniref:Endolytic murein transglycosylase n=1 Tax=Jiella endophytica TaxID=2558362 RepID=A0A4Y8R9G4_9HYPH|nr:endolytic transglycosylase MltG [Jiella endophytica]TFF18352.1 endolytic transglycosylase MltG [Jiella endophytica]
MNDQYADGDRRGYGGRSFKPSPAPKPPRRSRHARNQVVVFLNFCLSAALFVVLAAGALLYWGKSEFDSPGPLKQEATYVVPRSTGVSAIASGLEGEGIISSAEVFEYGVRLSGAGGQLKAGEFAFPPGASMRQVMEKLKSGDSIMHAVTIPEGWTVNRAYERIANADFLSGEMPGEVPEGTLKPDTYLVQRGATRKEIVRRMKTAQDQLVEEIWKGRDPDLPIKDIGQFITLASIVERETGIDGERAHVASVFINRLKKGMRLDSDPTFLYGVYGGAGKPSGQPVSQSDKDSDTPYNTYKVRGLPPGPIANPGKAALEAVAHPMETDDLYFVADGTGGHVFSSSLKEHNNNVAKYRALERQRAAERDAAPGSGG